MQQHVDKKDYEEKETTKRHPDHSSYLVDLDLTGDMLSVKCHVTVAMILAMVSLCITIKLIIAK